MLAEWKYWIIGFFILDFLVMFGVIRYVRKRSKKMAGQFPAFLPARSSSKTKINPLDHSTALAYQKNFVLRGLSREELFKIIDTPKDYPEWLKGVKKINILSQNPLIYEETGAENMIITFQEMQNQSPKLVIRVGQNDHLPGPMEVKFEGQQIQNSRTKQYDTSLLIAVNINLGTLAKNSIIQKPTQWMFQKMIEHWVKNFGESLQQFLNKKSI